MYLVKNTIISACVVALLFFCAACSGKKEKPKARPSAPVTVAIAVQKEVPIEIKAIGNIEPLNSVAVKSQVNGQIARVHFKDGSDVEKGALLISIDPETFKATLSQCEANLARDLAQARFAREQADRYELLLKDGIVTRDQHDQLRANAESIAAAVAADRASVRSARIQLGYCSIRSPISGRAGNLLLQPGNLVKANDLPLVTINQVDPIYATFTVPEKRLTDVKKAMAEGVLKIEAMVPGEPASKETGTLCFLDNTVNAATGTIRLRGLFTNKSRRFWPGQYVDVIMTLAMRQNAVVVPTQAIQVSQDGQFVYTVRPNRTVEMRRVTVAFESGGESVIDNGVAAGESVVTSGQLRLAPGAPVEVAAGRPAAVPGQ